MSGPPVNPFQRDRMMHCLIAQLSFGRDVRRAPPLNVINSPSSPRSLDFVVDPSVLALLDHPVEQHFVQFYESEDFLISSVARFAESGLRQGEAVLLVATATHLDGIETRLKSRGVDLGALKTCGSLILRDAHAVLAELTKTGKPSLESISALFNFCLEQRADKKQPIRVFGELVDLLSKEKRYDAALEVESLWNQLRKRYKFPLFCAYHLDAFAAHPHTDLLDNVCGTHTRVIPSESYSAVLCEDEKLRVVAKLQQKSLTLAHEIGHHRQTEERLRAVKDELEVQLGVSEDLLRREHIARSEAEAANRMKDEFLATISHELRTPLNAIIGWSHMLNRGQLDDETSMRALDSIERNAKTQAQLIEDILDVSRAITGKLRLNLAAVNPQTFIKAAVDSMQPAAESKNLVVEVSSDSSPARVLGDANRLQQVVWNLLANAIKFTQRGGKVLVQSKLIDDHLEITVIDNGQGIDPQFLPRVFDRFRQEDSSSTRRHGGLGLGLAIVRHLVDLHGGVVSAASNGLGQGATFRIVLPTLGDDVEVETANIQDCGSGLLAGVRVLVVDDDEENLELLGKILERQGACFQTANSAVSALTIVQRFFPDVFVLDLEMPVQDGYYLISRIRSQYASRRSPAIALTGHVRVEDRARALGAGFDMFVPKPVEADELVAAIVNLSLPSK